MDTPGISPACDGRGGDIPLTIDNLIHSMNEEEPDTPTWCALHAEASRMLQAQGFPWWELDERIEELRQGGEHEIIHFTADERKNR